MLFKKKAADRPTTRGGETAGGRAGLHGAGRSGPGEPTPSEAGMGSPGQAVPPCPTGGRLPVPAPQKGAERPSKLRVDVRAEQEHGPWRSGPGRSPGTERARSPDGDGGLGKGLQANDNAVWLLHASLPRLYDPERTSARAGVVFRRGRRSVWLRQAEPLEIVYCPGPQVLLANRSWDEVGVVPLLS